MSSKHELLETLELGIGPDDRRLFAQIIGAADNPDIFQSPFEEAYAALLECGLGSLVDSFRGRDTQPASPEALHELLCGEMRRLIAYWEDPALESFAYPLFSKTVAHQLGIAHPPG
jgi:hypothetical protein